MQQTFKKTVAGKNFQFNRLLYPLRYLIKSDEEGSDGTSVEFKKDSEGFWKPVKEGVYKFWIKEDLEEIDAIISANEVAVA